jgi:hypothetical protein
MTLRHHLVTMTNASLWQKGIKEQFIYSLRFLYGSCSFIQQVAMHLFFKYNLLKEAQWIPSKTIQLTNNDPATTTSSFLQLPNDDPMHFEQLHVPSTTSSTGQQADNDCHSTLNGIPTQTTTASTGQQADNDRHSTLHDVTTPTTKASTGLQANNDCHLF